MPLSAPTSHDPAVFSHTLRVYWEDTDAGGVVFYANHLKFFERARTEWLRARGVQQQALREAEGVIFVVAETQVRYLAPARLDDLLRVSVQPQVLGRASLTLVQQSWRVGADKADVVADVADIGAVATTATTATTTTPATPEQADIGPLLAEGTIRIGCVDAGTLRPCRIPNHVLAALQ